MAQGVLLPFGKHRAEPRGEPVMPWGKHKGTPLGELPLHYLRFITKWRTQPWAKPELKQALWAEYGRRVLADETLFARMVKRPPPELEELIFEAYDRRHEQDQRMRSAAGGLCNVAGRT